MTILFNHRIHSYKTASVRNRDISPKKVSYQKKTSINKKIFKDSCTTITDLMVNLKSDSQMITTIADIHPEPSAPLETMSIRVINVWGYSYTVEIPKNFDIYEGLRIWYPILYDAVIQEEQYERSLTQMEEDSTEEDFEEAWAHQDYLEWLYD